MKRLFILAMIMLFALRADAGTISGKIFDQESGKPVTGANALVGGTSLGAASDAEGLFKIAGVPDGAHTLKVQVLGYETVLITNIRIKGDTTVYLEIRLKRSVLEGEAVTVTADRLYKAMDRTDAIRKTGTGGAVRMRSDSPEKPAAPSGDFGGVVLTEADDHLKTAGRDKEDSGLHPASREVTEGPSRTAGLKGQSGLKAGYSDDNKQFNYFVNFLEKFKSTPHYDLPVGERIMITLKDASGRSMPNTDIEISADGKIIARGKTYPDGTWMFHPSAFEGDWQSFLVKAVSGGHPAEWTIPRQGRREMEGVLDVQKRAVQSVPLDILFILDTTGSMGEEIERLKKTIELINLNLASLSSKPAVRFGMVLYRDQGDDYVTRIVPFTEKLDLFQAALAPVRANGGGDGPEDLQSALQDAVCNMDWNQDGIRLGFIITDAPPHLDYGQEYTYVDAARDAKGKGIKLFSVGTGGLD
ncbi:carboxypeptidase-like regulatory domain-containing protein, partial [bacterium]|nr:carboxypeptidase-like regulatory domain-containing protein [bacterium]